MKEKPIAAKSMTIGLSGSVRQRPSGLGWMLVLPFVGDPGSYAINRRGQEPRG